MANFPGRPTSPIRSKAENTDGGPVTKKERIGIQRGHNVIPYNILLRGLTIRVDTTKIP